MNKVFNILILSVICLSGSCKKDPIIKPDPISPIYKSILDIKWHRYFYPDTAVAYIFDPLINDQYVGFCSKMLVTHISNKLGIGIFDKQSGAMHPAWNGAPGININSSIEFSNWLFGGIYNEFVVTNDYHKIDCYNINTGSVVWSKYIDDLGPKIRSYKNLLFVTSYDQHSYTKLYVFDIATGNQKRLITMYKTNGYEASIKPPGVWINPDGDTVLIFQNRQWNFPASDGKVDLYAYNMRTDSILWEINDISNDGNSSVYPPIIDGNRAYFQGMKSLHGINLLTGQIIWEHEYSDEGFAQVENLCVGGKLYVHSGSDVLMAFDGNTGNLMWRTDNDYGIEDGGSMGIYKGKLYFNSIDMTDDNVPQLLFCLNTENGNLIWKGSGVMKSGVSGGLCIDQKTGYLYCTDASSIMCIDLNNSPIK